MPLSFAYSKNLLSLSSGLTNRVSFVTRKISLMNASGFKSFCVHQIIIISDCIEASSKLKALLRIKIRVNNYEFYA